MNILLGNNINQKRMTYMNIKQKPCYQKAVSIKLTHINALGVCPMQVFHFWSRDVHPVQNLLLCSVYKISSKSDDFSLRYGDMSIFKIAAVRHLEIVLPPYETTHEVSVAGRSCLSNFMSIWYTDLKIYVFEFFWHIWLEMPIHAPKWGFWGTLDT